MIGTALFLLCAAANIAHTYVEETETTEAEVERDLENFYENGCPKDSSVFKLLPHENCEQYYQCVHGALISRFCPNGLRFHVDLERCDWHVRCFKGQVEVYDTSTEELEKSNPNHAFLICAADNSNGVLVAHDNCNEFYKCSYGKPVPLKCAYGLLFNTITGKCSPEEFVVCGERINLLGETDSTVTVSSMDTQTPPSTVTELVSRDFVTETEKKLSYRNIQTHEIVLDNDNEENESSGDDNNDAEIIESSSKSNDNEANNEKFNSETETANYNNEANSENVNSETRITNNNKAKNENFNSETEVTNNNGANNENVNSETEITVFDICGADNSDGVKISHKECNSFYKCIKGKPVAFTCPGNLIFNEKKNDCDYPVNVDCGNRIDSYDTDSNNTSNIRDPSQAHAICSADGSDGVLVSHESCNKFYECHFGMPVVVKCPGILLFNPKVESCDWPTHVDCSDRIVLEDSDSTNSYPQGEVIPYFNDANIVCGADNSDGKLLPHENCNQYYKCFKRKPMAQFCQINLYYNPEKEYCDWLHNVNCTYRVISDNTNIDEEDRYDPNEKCRGKPDGVIIPHENCSQFYKCVNGHSYSMACRTGLYFNNLLNICDWPMNVDCGERLTDAQIQNMERLK